uniref:Macaca fascicularis brain cDNA clone: QmoA-11952, similar to human ataxia telangiectasia and Rad3 related (ATR), mRNA, RefSeq: NM_001184.2 n=1 Tax=Macaca fascicularis TaxID=9541 RepID=I7GPA9_MACFA|nr:unnamed protein product [Macaca fascicularis]
MILTLSRKNLLLYLVNLSVPFMACFI